jgi:hypothetical protein
LKKQIKAQEKIIKELSGFSNLVSPDVTKVYTKKERAHLKDRQEMLREVEKEYADWKARGER